MMTPTQSSSIPPGDRAAAQQLLKRLRAHRLARNWTQDEMARRAGMSRATYQNLEGGYGNPTLSNLMRILGILGFTDRIAELLPEPEEPQTLESLRAHAEPAARVRASRKRASAST